MESFMSQETIYIKEISGLEKDTVRFEEKRWSTDKNLKQNQQEIFNINRTILTDSNEIEKSQQKIDFIHQKITEKKIANDNYDAENKKLTKQLESEMAKGARLETKRKYNKDYLSYSRRQCVCRQTNASR